jgi:hypothetical protein
MLYALQKFGDDCIKKYFHFLIFEYYCRVLLAKGLVFIIQSVLNLLKPDCL